MRLFSLFDHRDWQKMNFALVLSLCFLVVAETKFKEKGEKLMARLQIATNQSRGLEVRPDQSRTICTDGMPPQLARFGISDLCMDIDVYGCGETIGVGLRFKESPSYIVQQDIDTTFPQICVPTQNLSNSPLQVICKGSVLLCVTFMRLGQNTLVIGPDYASGCPTFTIGNCQLPIIGPIPTMNLPLDCFDVGQGKPTPVAHRFAPLRDSFELLAPLTFFGPQIARRTPTATRASRAAGGAPPRAPPALSLAACSKEPTRRVRRMRRTADLRPFLQSIGGAR